MLSCFSFSVQESRRPKSSKKEISESATYKNKKIRERGREEKTNTDHFIPTAKDNLPSVGVFSREETAKRPESSYEEKEAGEHLASSLLSEPKPKKIQENLRLKGNGQNVKEVIDKQADVLVKSSMQEEKKMVSLLKAPKSRKVKVTLLLSPCRNMVTQI